MPTKYLYGAAVHSIQNFIFETGKLKEIVGASELVLQICGEHFEKAVPNYQPSQHILKAAGKIIYRFDQEEDCQAVIKNFTKMVKELAPAIQFSQAVVAIEDNGSKAALNKLDDLLDAQRNRSNPSHGMGLMITERARRTGRAGFKKESAVDPNSEDDKALVDRTQDRKFQAFGNNSLKDKILPRAESHRVLANNINQITPGNKGWLAIVHADGNSLGKSIQAILTTKGINTIDFYQQFSQLLDKATISAAKAAYIKSVQPKIGSNQTIPLRPVLLGGDDLTLIIRGDLALDFTATYLQLFQEKTAEYFKDLSFPESLKSYLQNGLTACAGIAFIKPNYPFHYGVSLSEDLTKAAKKAAKKIKGIPSSLAFHKVQSSFIGDYEEIKKRELSAETSNIQFHNGPYFLDKQSNHATIEELNKWVHLLQKADAPRSNLREWLTELQTNEAGAEQLLERIINIHPRFRSELNQGKVIINRAAGKSTPIFDALTIESIANNY